MYFFQDVLLVGFLLKSKYKETFRNCEQYIDKYLKKLLVRHRFISLLGTN